MNLTGLTLLQLWFAMLNPALCDSRTAKHWATLTWRIFNSLTNPSFVLPILFSIILLPWLVRPLRQKRQLSGLGIALLLSYGLLCSPFGIMMGNQILVGALPKDVGQPADAIVVLGRGREARLMRTQVAAELWQAKRAPLIFASGWGDAPPIAKLLNQKGLPPQAIDGEPCSRTTEENARFTAAILQPQGVKKILLVTDPPHMLRSLLTFRSLGFEVIPHPSPRPPQLNARKEAFLIVREYLGLVSYGVLGRFFPREAPPADTVAQHVTEIQLADPGG